MSLEPKYQSWQFPRYRQFNKRYYSGYLLIVQSRSRVPWSGVELLQSGRELTTKVGEQSWPQLVRYALICYHMCGCIFQEDRIVVRSAGEKWYID